jgi:hypothetical protein
MNGTAYYRDIINRILTENDDDDIPMPPSRKDLKKQQFLRKVERSEVDRKIWMALIRGYYDKNFGMLVLPLGKVMLKIDFKIADNKLTVRDSYNIAVDSYTLAPAITDENEWNRWLETELMAYLNQKIKKEFTIDANCVLIGNNRRGDITVSCPEFTQYMQKELEELPDLMHKLSPYEIYHYIRSL